MTSEPQYTYKNPIYLKPIIHPVKYENAQGESIQGEGANYTPQEIYKLAESNGVTVEQYEKTNYNNEVTDINVNSFTQDNTINQSNPIYSFGEENQINSIDLTNQDNNINSNNQYDYTNINTNINTNNYDNQITTFNEYKVTNPHNYSEEINKYNQSETTNQIISNYQSNTITYQPNEIYTESQIYTENQPNEIYTENQSYQPNEIYTGSQSYQQNEIYTDNQVYQQNEIYTDNQIYQQNEIYTDNQTYQQNETYTDNQINENPIISLVDNHIDEKPIVSLTENQINEKPIVSLAENQINEKPIISLAENKINEKPFISLADKISDNVKNKVNEIKQLSVENPINSVDFSQANDKSGVNKINQIYTNESSNINVLNSINTVKSIKNPILEKEFHEEEEIDNNPQKIDSPRLINPLEPPYPPSPILLSINKEGEDEGKINLENRNNLEGNLKIQENTENKIGSNILTPDEKGLLNTEKNNLFKDYNTKTHYQLTLLKEPYGFNYEKVHKTGVALLSHFEMPQNYEYRSPILSSNGKYLSCIAHGTEDFVYIWDISDLYWYKYKFSSSRVDGISFTPDSNSIIIIYRYANPTMYNLSDGKKILDLEANGEENNREGFQWAYTINGTHFAYTSDKSFTLWSLRTGEIKKQIFEESPIKIISNEYLICISNDLNTLIKRISSEEDVVTFKIKGVESPNDILDARCTNDMSSFLYVIKEGIIRYIFNDKEYKGVQKFLCGVDKAKISEDCKYVLKTNMKNISIYDIDKDESICTLLKDKFKEFRVDFKLKKVVVIDDISINIQQYDDDGAPEKYVWLDKNPKKFEDVKFSRDSKVLLARINRNKAIAYDLLTGYVVKKWQNVDENWLDYAMTKYGGDNIATKSHLLLIKVWNFRTGREEACFYGYDSHSFSFSGSGLYLACGTKCGSEIARIWDIKNQKYGVFRYNGSNNNFNTVVHLTSPEPKYLICCAINQKPLVFNTHTKEFLFDCECPYIFEEIYGIQSDLLYDVFIVKGKDEKKIDIGLLYKFSDGSLLETFENYSVLELAKNNGVIIVKCENFNGGKLTSINIKNLNDRINNDFQIQTEKCKLLNDNKVAIIEYGDDNNKEFNLISVENGTYIGKINFVKNNDRKSSTYLTVDPYTKEMYFRYLEFLSPQETMIYKKKDIFSVENES